MPIAEIVIVLAACVAVVTGLRWPMERTSEPFFTFGPSGKPTVGRILAVAFLALGGGVGIYAISRKDDWLLVLVFAPLLYFVLIIFVASNRFIQRFVLKPFLLYAGALAIAVAVLFSGRDLWQALKTRTIPFRRGGSNAVRIEADAFLFWWCVFWACVWIWLILVLAKSVFVQYRRGIPLYRNVAREKRKRK